MEPAYRPRYLNILDAWLNNMALIISLIGRAQVTRARAQIISILDYPPLLLPDCTPKALIFPHYIHSD